MKSRIHCRATCLAKDYRANSACLRDYLLLGMIELFLLNKARY
jgi:hypothetical protein